MSSSAPSVRSTRRMILSALCFSTIRIAADIFSDDFAFVVLKDRLVIRSTNVGIRDWPRFSSNKLPGLGEFLFNGLKWIDSVYRRP